MSISESPRAAVILFATSLLGTAQAEASLLIYSESVVGSGTLGTTSFTNQTITISGIGDTNNVTGLNTTSQANMLTSTTVTIGGGGPVALTDSFGVTFGQESSADVYFYDITNQNLFSSIYTSPIPHFDLRTAIGPVQGSTYGQLGGSYSTSAGTFTFTSGQPQNGYTTPPGQGSFQSSVVVPEPSSLTTFALAGTIGLSYLRWKRQRASV